MFHNKELQKLFSLYFLISIISLILGFHINILTGILVIFNTAAYGIAFYIFTRKRYKSIAHISEQIDLVLHNADQLYISDNNEGELSILQCEITKMTRRIHEQNQCLKNEKKFLADSLADIAHQLRTPLTSVNLILSLLEDCKEEAERISLLRETKQLFVQMDWLLNSLLKMSRLDADIVSFQKEAINMYKLVNTALQPFQISMDLHNITVRLNISNSITIQGDFAWLSEALQNIMKNCMESTGENGFIQINCEDNALFTELTIHDNGSGFDKEDLAFLFQRFYRGKNTGATGYGIGLALSKMIITSHNGTISAKNHPDGGAVFIVRFPK